MEAFRKIRRWIKPRTAGVKVSRSVLRAIEQGNLARSLGNWNEAARQYGMAVEQDPTLTHILIQLGHALKESGELERSNVAYKRAVQNDAKSHDAQMHLARSSKVLGLIEDAEDAYFASLDLNPFDFSTLNEVIASVKFNKTRLSKFENSFSHFGLRLPSQMDDAQTSAELYIDISDLLSYFRNARLPTGIQRVQIELARELLNLCPSTAAVCIYASSRNGWVTLPTQKFMNLASLAVESDDRTAQEWQSAVIDAAVHLAAMELLEFPRKATLLNLGTSWSEKNYLLHVRSQRNISNILYIPIVFDLIPMFRPEWFPNVLVRDYRSWVINLVDSADGYLAISQATKKDLLKILNDNNRYIREDLVKVVPLDAKFEQHAAAGSDSLLSRFNLDNKTFVLMVSTIEPRKNHIRAFESWKILCSDLGYQRVPLLICVGGAGWMNEQVHAFLRRNRKLRSRIKILHGVSDPELAMLYQNAIFTLYPSLYEGWGLPVTESLGYNKIPAVANSSALTEAGKEFAVYFDPYDASSIASAVLPLIMDDGFRELREATIRSGYRPRSWQEVGEGVLRDIKTFQNADPRGRPIQLLVIPGVEYGLGLEAVNSGEAARIGYGWSAPSAKGNRISGPAELLIRLLEIRHWTLGLHFRSLNGTVSRIIVNGLECDSFSNCDGENEVILVKFPRAENYFSIKIEVFGEVYLDKFQVT